MGVDSTSKKSALRMWLSRLGSPVFTELSLDGGGDAGLQRVRRGDDGPFELVEAAADLAHHHVPDDEGHLGVHGVDRPRPGDVAGNLHGSLAHISSR
jgi:hypothetical protein